MTAKKALAALILSTGVGLYVEAQLEDGRLTRAPLSGAVVLGASLAICWAADELAGKHEAGA